MNSCTFISLLIDKRIPETMGRNNVNINVMCMLMFIPTYGIFMLIRLFAVITKYTVLDEQRREAKEGKSQRKTCTTCTVQCPCTRAEAERLGEIIS